MSSMLFKKIHRGIEFGHLVLALVFIACAIALLALALVRLSQGVNPTTDTFLDERVSEVLESIALLTVAIAVLELGQTIIEEEVQRATPMSGPTRVRRFLSRFMMVLVVALSLETLVAVFKFAREDPSQLPGAAAVGLVAAVLLAAWGLFVRFSQRVEEMEPDGLEEVRREDEKVAGQFDVLEGGQFETSFISGSRRPGFDLGGLRKISTGAPGFESPCRPGTVC